VTGTLDMNSYQRGINGTKRRGDNHQWGFRRCHADGWKQQRYFNLQRNNPERFWNNGVYQSRQRSDHAFRANTYTARTTVGAGTLLITNSTGSAPGPKRWRVKRRDIGRKREK